MMPCSRDSPYSSSLGPTVLSAIYSSSLCLYRVRSFVEASYQIPLLYKISGDIKVLHVYINTKCNRCINLDGHTSKIKPQKRRLYSDSLQGVRSRDRILEGVRFYPPFQTGPGAHPAYYTMGSRLLPGVKQLDSGVNHPSHLEPKLKKV
jgi:hypothetical protein